MTSSRAGLAASLVATVVHTAVRLLFVPLHLALLGPEAFGLVGFYASLAALLTVLDLGLGQAIAREVARAGANPEEASRVAAIFRSLERGYLALVLGGVVVLATAGALAGVAWFRASQLDADTLRTSTALLAAVAVLQLLGSFYQAMLLGLQRHVSRAVILTAVSLSANAGAAIWLVVLGRTPVVFFGWQLATVVAQLVATRWLVVRDLPPAAGTAVAGHLRELRTFAVGMSGITLTSILITQSDKLLLSRLLSLEAFGLYTVSVQVTTGVSALVGAVFVVILPKLSALAAAGDDDAFHAYYRRATHAVVCLVLPVALLVTVFANDMLTLWLRDADRAAAAAATTVLLVMAAAVNAVMYLPYAAQLAHGRTRLAIGLNVVMLAINLPALVTVVPRFGALGAAAVSLAVQVCYAFVGIPMTHAKLPLHSPLDWLGRDVLPSAAAAAALTVAVRVFHPEPLGMLALAVTLAAAFLVAGLASSDMRARAVVPLRRLLS